MIAAYAGQPVRQEDIARWLRTTDIGTPARNVNRLAAHGFKVVYQEGSLQFLHDALTQGTPCILFLRTGELPYWTLDTAHAVVLAGIEGEQAYLNDPVFPDAPQVVSIDVLMLAWSWFDYSVATFSPAD